MLFSLSHDRAPRAHFIGIGGMGMVAGARLAIEAGWEVRGSDNPLYPPSSDMVKELGVPVAEGYAAANLDWEPDLVVVGNAMSRGNPEVEALLERRMHYVSLPEWLKDAVLRARHPVVITGTHGKTTTTALTAHLLDHMGLAPGYLIGGQPLDFPHSSRLGEEGAPFVIEGDEYDTAFFDKRAKFLHYLPEVAVVTSVEFDHGDIYRDIDEIELAFERMLRQLPPSGHLILCADHERALKLKALAPCAVTTYGFAEDADLRIRVDEEAAGRQAFTLFAKGEGWSRFRTTLPGKYNLQNIAAAVAVAQLHHVTPDDVSAALNSFQGIRRRMEVFHESQGALFVDDFAHHPTAIAGAVLAARAHWPGRRIRVLFEPRTNTTISKRFQDDLRDSFLNADEVWLGPVYREERIPKHERLDRDEIVCELVRRGINAHFTDDVDEIVDDLRETIDAKDLILVLSNGAFGGIYATIRDAFPGD